MSVVYSLGLMTGTSCDGADLALLKFAGERETLERTESRHFPDALRARLREAQRGRLDIEGAALLNRDYSVWVAEAARLALSRWKIPIRDTVISIHGQTVWHEPDQRISVQLLDPAIVSERTGCTVTASFRQPDLARGGQGAPLVPLYHWLRSVKGPLARDLPFAIHNVGGIANLTYVARDRGKVIAFDTGPGNCLIDMATEKATRGKHTFDDGGRLALSALEAINWPAVQALASGPFFRKKPPKSTGRELFDESYLKRIPGRGATLVANATALTAHTMARAYVDFVLPRRSKLNAVFVAGGGVKNDALIMLFRHELAHLSGRHIPVSALPPAFAPAQYLEAMAFARLGYEALQGRPVSLSTVTGARSDAVGAGVFPGTNYARLLKAVDVI